MDDPLWGRVDVGRWQQTPCIRGRIAVEQDVRDGRAVFYLGNPEETGAVHVDIGLPHCGIVRAEGTEIPAVIIQSEQLITSTTLVIVQSAEGTDCVYFPKSSYC